MGGLCSDHTRNHLKAFPSALSFDDTEESERQVSTFNDKLSRLRYRRSNSNVVSNKSQPSVSSEKAEPVLLVKQFSLVEKRKSSMNLSLVSSKSEPKLENPVLSQPIIREDQKDEDKKSSMVAGSKVPTFGLKPTTLEPKLERNEDVQPSKNPSTPLQLKSTQCYRNTLFEIMNRDNLPSPKSPDSLAIPAVFTKHRRRNTYSGPTKALKRKRKLTFEIDERRGANAETCEKQQSERRAKQQDASSEELPDMNMQRSLRKRISAISDNDQDILRLSTCF